MLDDHVRLISQGLSVPVHLVLNFGVGVAFEGLRQDAGRFVLRFGSLK